MPRARWLTLLALTLTPLFLGGSALAAPPYPATPPDFAHPGSPHDSGLEFYGANMYSPAGGAIDRPMLVVYLRFSDVTAPSFVNAAWLANRFFGPFPSVANYFADDSFGRLTLSPAAESNTADGGAVDDGVVTVDVGTSADWFAMSVRMRNRTAVQMASADVDFAALDVNPADGVINDREINFHTIEESGNATGGGGITRDTEPGTTVDGKTVRFLVAMDNTATNLMTIIHEAAHVAIHMRDLYGFGVGSLDISGPTIGPADPFFFRTSAWQRMHVGWSVPRVVTRDGFVQVNNAALAGESFILYDPDAGTDRYYMVEHRSRGDASDYDQNASDTGLVIWRIDDAQYNSGDPYIRPIELRRPDGFQAPVCAGGCYGGSNRDAWNPSDPNTPQRTFDEDWFPNVAVRAINAPRGDGIIEAFFDVRGAGVLVDPNTPQGVPMTVNVTPEEMNPITFPVMNTGDDLDGDGPMTPTDTFDFTLTGLPAGWTATTDTRTLGGHEGATAAIQLVPEPNAPTGITQVNALGRSTSDPTVVSGRLFDVNIVLDDTLISYVGSVSRPTGEAAGFHAYVSNPDDAGTPPVPGETVTFELSGPGGTQTAMAVSDATGLAAVSPPLTLTPGTYTLTVSVPRLGKHAPASITQTYTVERRPTLLSYTGDTSGQYSDPSSVSATLVDSISGTPLVGFPVDLSIGTQTVSATTDAMGAAAGSITVDQAAGANEAGARFAGDTTYRPATTAVSFPIAKENLTFAYTGDTLVELPGVPTLSAQATEEADGSPGDLSLAGARFDLAPTLGSTPRDFTASVDATGAASTPATGTPVDLWSVSVSVPATNAYWTGATAAPTELALFDPGRRLKGDGRGPDAALAQTKAKTEDIRFDDGIWKKKTKLESSAGKFEGESYDWVIAVGNQAILQVDGLIDRVTPATLRLRILDAGPGGIDTFHGVVRDALSMPVYDSGVVSITHGNLRVE